MITFPGMDIETPSFYNLVSILGFMLVDIVDFEFLKYHFDDNDHKGTHAVAVPKQVTNESTK